MSSPDKSQLEAVAKEKFINDFWSSLTTDKKFEILQFRFGNLLEEDYQEWLAEQKNEL